jgi:FkbM family methyltransferase
LKVRANGKRKMSLKALLDPVFSFAARTCEKSPAAAHLIRSFDFKGKGSIIQRIRPGAMSRQVTADCDGLRYRLDLSDDVQRELYFNRYERADIQQALELVPRGGTCFDVGANNGAFTLQFARKVGEHGLVHAFEPDPYVFSRLESNCRMNGFEDRVRCHNVAVTNLTGPRSFYQSDRHHSGWGSLVKFKDIAVHTQKVQGVTMDGFLANEGIRHVDLLKVDVEAHEPEVLEGSMQCLANHVFRFVLIEFNGIRLAERGKTLEDFLRPLTTTGYEAVTLRVALLKKMQDRRVPAELMCTNFLFATGN